MRFSIYNTHRKTEHNYKHDPAEYGVTRVHNRRRPIVMMMRTRKLKLRFLCQLQKKKKMMRRTLCLINILQGCAIEYYYRIDPREYANSPSTSTVVLIVIR